MCCGVAALAGVVAGVAAFFATAAIAGHLLAPDAGASAATAAVAGLAKGGAPGAPAGALLPLGCAAAPPLAPLPAPLAAALAALPPGAAARAVPALAAAARGAAFAEHGLLALLLAWWLAAAAASRLARRGRPDAPEPSRSLLALRARAARVKGRAGPPRVLEWRDVKPAPAATMGVERLEDGQVVSHVDGRGAIYRFKIKGDTLVNMYYTKAGEGGGRGCYLGGGGRDEAQRCTEGKREHFPRPPLPSPPAVQAACAAGTCTTATNTT
jgi:hypothetical protein